MQGLRIAKIILKKSNKGGAYTLTHFKTYCGATEIRSAVMV